MLARLLTSADLWISNASARIWLFLSFHVFEARTGQSERGRKQGLTTLRHTQMTGHSPSHAVKCKQRAPNHHLIFHILIKIVTFQTLIYVTSMLLTEAGLNLVCVADKIHAHTTLLNFSGNYCTCNVDCSYQDHSSSYTLPRPELYSLSSQAPLYLCSNYTSSRSVTDLPRQA